MSREQHYLLDILFAAEDALSYVKDMTFENFQSNGLVRDAVLYCLTVIGEAAGRIDRMPAAIVPDLPWREMKDLRNLVVHQYEGVNLPTIWKIISTDLPLVIAILDPLFPERHSQ